MNKSRHPVPTRAWLLLVLAGFAGMLFYIDRQTLSVLKTTLKVEQQWTDTQYSWLITAFMVPYTLCYLVTGRLIDRWGTRLMMPLFLGVMSLATVMSGLADDLWFLGASRFVLGAAEAGIIPAVLVTIVKWFPPDRRGTANTLNKPLTVAGQVLVAPMAVLITAELGWRWAFMLPGLAGLAVAAAWWHLDQDPPRQEPRESRPPPVRYREILAQPLVRAVFIARIISDPLWFFLIFWQPGYLQEVVGMTLDEFGRVGWIPAAASVGFIMSLGYFSDRLIQRGSTPATSRTAILMATACLSPAVLVLPWVGNPILALALLTIIQVMTATWLSMSGLLISDLVPGRMVGSSVALLSAFGAGTGAIFNFGAGPLIDAFGYHALLTAGSLLHPLAAFVLWQSHRQLGRKPADPPAP